MGDGIKYYVLRIMYQTKGQKIYAFTDLHAWQEAHKLAILVYQVTKTFPKEELFCLTSQMRCAAISIISNIAEGFSRKSLREKIQFYAIAQGSNTELQSQLLIACDVGLISKSTLSQITTQSLIVHKLINGLIKHCQKYT